MKKIVLSIALVLAISLCVPAFAVSPRTTSYTPSLSFSGTTANCKVNIVDIGKYIDASLELWRGETLIDSWTGRGTSAVHISGNCEVDSGTTYTLKVTGTVGDSTISVTPIVRTCP